jgi:hypothetical protein
MEIWTVLSERIKQPGIINKYCIYLWNVWLYIVELVVVITILKLLVAIGVPSNTQLVDKLHYYNQQ